MGKQKYIVIEDDGSGAKQRTLQDALRDAFLYLFLGVVILLVIYVLFDSTLADQDTSIFAQGSSSDQITIQTTSVSGYAPIKIGCNAVIVYPGTVNVRVSPGYANKSDTDLLCGGAGSGEQFTVIDGPQYVDGLTWWKLSNARCTGWVAETTQRGVLILQDP